MNHEDYMTEIESKSEIEKLFSNKKIPLMFEASSGSVGRNESLIWQQGRDI
jgi:hypothetical protein